MQSKKKHWWRVISALAAALLYGCVATYQEPVGENRATLTFVNQTDLPLAVDMFRDASRCRYRQKLNSMVPANGRFSIDIPTDVETAIGIVNGYEDTLKYCRIIVSFRADRARKYQIISGKNPDKCFVKVVDKALHDDSPSEGTPTVASKRNWLTLLPLGEEGPWCEPEN